MADSDFDAAAFSLTVNSAVSSPRELVQGIVEDDEKTGMPSMCPQSDPYMCLGHFFQVTVDDFRILALIPASQGLLLPDL